MIVANTKGRVSTLAVDDDLDMNGRNVTNADVVSVNDHVTLVGAQRFPGKGFRSNERNGWGVSKDNGDVERKFWKDDFSVNTEELYTVNGNWTGWGSGELTNVNWSGLLSLRTTTPTVGTRIGVLIKPITHGDGTEYFGFGFKNVDVASYISVMLRSYNSTSVRIMTMGYSGATVSTTIETSVGDLYGQYCYVEIEVLSANTYDIYVNGTKYGSTVTETGVNLLQPISVGMMTSGATGLTRYLKGRWVLPSKSYEGNFSSDTVTGANGRYQAVTGTVAYDDANKRMNVTTAAGVNGKASGRLKSYKFCEGSQIYDVLLPTGADGDFICLATHSANGLMTDGIGVGLQSDGAGNWNLATLSNTTVTGGASSGLVDGKTARIEIEKDLSGAYWYYIYDAAGAKPTAATGKLFTSLTEGYTGWYANGAGATTQTYAIDNISIRAESIVGRTNVEVEEAGYRNRIEFGVNDSGRWRGDTSSFTWDIVNGCLIPTISNRSMLIPTTSLSQVEIETSITIVEGENRTNGSLILACQSNTISGRASDVTGTSLYYVVMSKGFITLSKNILGVNTQIVSIENAITNGETVVLKVAWDGRIGNFKLYKNGVQIGDVAGYTDTALTRGYCGISISYINPFQPNSVKYNYLQISGTRVYNKPIHRGAMLETYHDGTQEVVGTTFIDDCQWDRSAEYTSLRGTWTHDTTNGYIQVANTGSFGNGYSLKSLQFDEGVIEFDVCRYSAPASDAGAYGIILNSDGELNSSHYSFPKNGILVATINPGEYVNGTLVGSWAPVTASSSLVWQKWRIELKKSQGQILLYLDGALAYTYTIAQNHVNRGIIFFAYNIASASNVRFKNIQIIAAESSSTDGIAACIPPIGGGARYGVQEEVYHTYTNEVRKGKYLVSTCVKTTNADAEAIEMYLENTTDSTAITEDASKTVAIALTDTNYMDVEKEMELGYADRGDTLKVAVRKTDAATEVSPACFVEMLNVTPTIEVI